jgi:acyl-CoA synthetase (AMP-forming)/AMP-acid ligase II
MTFAGLLDLLVKSRGAFNRRGLGRGDRIAIVLPNGPALATTFLSVASVASAAPINPALPEDEIKSCLSSMGAKALVTDSFNNSAAEIARGLGLTVLLSRNSSSGVTGDFSIEGDGSPRTSIESGFASGTDVALLLQTSGTTSYPKTVALDHIQLVHSAHNIVSAMGLQVSDCGLNIMPLFHIHGIMAGLVAPLSCGSSVYCSTGFNAFKFAEMLHDSGASWYTGVPTMHQAALARVCQNTDLQHSLRFIRSSSSPMSKKLMADLEEFWGVPVIEAYGMTEACHQIASNSIAGRRGGSVGRPIGTELAVVDDKGRVLENGEVGEIIIRGKNVISAYETIGTLNEGAFIDGWLRTGDLGFLDPDNNLWLTGRIKEIVNRGGEKISPREIDEFLMTHPSVVQALAFAVPHPSLGEDIAAAVVLGDGAVPDENELRDFLRDKLANYKIPRKIYLLPELPKGPTGKLQRIGLAKALGLS